MHLYTKRIRTYLKRYVFLYDHRKKFKKMVTILYFKMTSLGVKRYPFLFHAKLEFTTMFLSRQIGTKTKLKMWGD